VKKIDPVLLEEAVQRIVVALRPERIYLYGSHAYGQPHEDSDVDLLVVVPQSSLSASSQEREVSSHTRKGAIKAYRALRGLFLPAEIKVVTKAEFEQRSQWLSSIERIVEEKGRMLYDAMSG